MDKRSEIQQGFVSIITASLIMIITTLIVIGFSQLMQREQRQSLDRQLNSQALYAAETGLNDLYDRLQKGELTKEENLDDCSVDDWPNGGIVNPDSTNEAAYTCILYDQTPSYLEFNNGAVTTQQSKIFPIQPKGSGTDSNPRVKSLKFSWSGASANTDFTLDHSGNCSPTALGLPINASEPGVPILRVDLVRLPTDTAISLNTLTEEGTITFFLYPKNGCGETSSDYSSHTSAEHKGKVIGVSCRNANGYACEYEITNMHSQASTESDRYFARIKSIYNDADVRIEGNSTASGNGGVIEFVGAQVIADVTGKSNDVLRRIKVQIGNPGYPIPEFVVQGLSGVCKGIEISPPNSADTRLCP
jgi:Tfp pilus assembly protein PilX